LRTDPDFEGFYVREYAPVYRAVYALAGDPEIAQDSAQEAFARGYAGWARIGGEPWAGGWVMTTALNVARRSMRRSRDLPADAAPSSPDLDALVDLRRAISRLPARQQAAVIMHYLMDLPIVQVAGAMGCRTGTVKSHLAKARASLGAEVAMDEPRTSEASRD
jgi:RNA polymerase sigma-70 factor (ECF subfamily)